MLVIMSARAWCHSPFFFAGVHCRCTGRKSRRNAAAAFVSVSVASCADTYTRECGAYFGMQSWETVWRGLSKGAGVAPVAPRAE